MDGLNRENKITECKKEKRKTRISVWPYLANDRNRSGCNRGILLYLQLGKEMTGQFRMLIREANNILILFENDDYPNIFDYFVNL